MKCAAQQFGDGWCHKYKHDFNLKIAKETVPKGSLLEFS